MESKVRERSCSELLQASGNAAIRQLSQAFPTESYWGS